MKSPYFVPSAPSDPVPAILYNGELLRKGRAVNTHVSKRHKTARMKATWQPQPCCLFLLPTCAEKPVLIAVTDRLLAHELHVTKYRRFSPLFNSVSGDLQVLQVTYSTEVR